MLKKYYQLTKPGIIYGNLLSALAGFFLASARHRFDPWLLLAMVAGTSLIIASGCVFNNYLDRTIDKKMARTRQRALVQQTIPVSHALIFGAVLMAAGFTVLWRYTNPLVTLIGWIGWLDYVVLYGWAKRHSVHGTLVGTIAGATPIVAGYCAVTGQWDTAATLLFALMVAWQMPHFYGIAMYRHKDYKAAGLPVRPVAKSMDSARRQSIFYMVVFVVAAALLSYYRYTGYLYLLAITLLGLVWLIKALVQFKAADDATWGRKMFLFSLIALLTTSVLLSTGGLLP